MTLIRWLIYSWFSLLDNTSSYQTVRILEWNIVNKHLDVCENCNSKCLEDNDAIQCDLCHMWVHAKCDNVSKEQYNAKQAHSVINNCVYFCKANNCAARSWCRILTEGPGWDKPAWCLIQSFVRILLKQTGQLASAHDKIEKAVSDLARILTVAAGDKAGWPNPKDFWCSG